MKIISAQQAAEKIHDGMTIMIGGFMTNGTPQTLMDAMVKKGIKDLTVIANDAGFIDSGIGKLIAAGALRRLIASHIGLNPQAGQLMNEGKLEIDLVPQGTLAERIRAGGAGLGGILTPTGIGTSVAEGKTICQVDGRDYLLETPLRADVALIHGSIIDPSGNIFYAGTTRNFNPIIAMAADLVIAATSQIMPVGSIASENIVTPGILVDYVVEGETK